MKLKDIKPKEYRRKPVRMFAPFQNKEHMDTRLEDLLNKMPKKYKADLWLWIGQYESTLAEGFSDNLKQKFNK